MINNLQNNEIMVVSGGFFSLAAALSAVASWLYTKVPYMNRFECMGEGRNVPIACHGGEADLNGPRGWKVHEKNAFFCSVWFCCSGDKGNYTTLILNNRSYNCTTGESHGIG